MSLRERVAGVWREVLDLSWPIMLQHVLRTAMRTTDVLVTGFFSPAAIAAIGLADLYARLPLRIGLGLGSGAIALSSQDTGASESAGGGDGDAGDERDPDDVSAAEASRDEAITQALLVGAVGGLPFVLFGWLLGEQAIALLGAPAEVARMGGLYLAVVFATAPARHVALVGSRSLQGTGDTRTPMWISGAASVLNIAGSLVLGLGLLGAPRLGIVGVGLSTAAGNVFTAALLLSAMATDWTPAGFARPTNPVITRQLLAVAAPRIGEGMVATVVEFPFNSLLLGFGTSVNAAYQVGRRLYQQVTSPVSRGLNVAASVVVGQALGEGDPREAAFRGWATAALGMAVVGTVGLLLFVGADQLVGLFTDDATTAGYAAGFARAYGLAAPALAAYVVLAGALQGGSETRVPFLARTTGLVGFFRGFSYVTGVLLGWGPTGVYAGIVLFYVWGALVVGAGFRWGGWATRATDMMAERGTAPDADSGAE